jgi:hypothetical protein
VKRISVLMLVALVCVGVSGCGNERLREAEELRRIMRRTERESRGFVYTERAGNSQLVVKGLIEDDFRYKATLSVNGSAVYDEVASDDALAARVLQPAGFTLLRRQQAAAPAVPGGPTAPATATPEALLSRRWILDKVGAPSLLPSTTEKHLLGDDPVFDALTAFRYVDQAMREAFQVKKFNEDDLQYKAKEDPFPKPEKGSGVERFDILRVFLPKPQQTAGLSGNQIVPAYRHFRKMSVYVKDGLVIQVLEQIDVASRLEEITDRYNVDIPANLSTERKVEIVVDSINAVRRGQGNDPIRVRTMSLEFVRVGERVKISLPPQALEQSLSVLKNRGKAVATTPPT